MLGTLQYSVVYTNFPPPSPPLPSKRPHCPLWRRRSLVPLVLVFPRNPVLLRFKVLCRSSSAAPGPLGQSFRPPFATSKPSVESFQRSQTHPCRPRKKALPKNLPGIADWNRQNRSSRHRFFVPVGLFSHPLSWRRSSSRIGVIPIEPGPNSPVSALARLVDVKKPSEMLWNGDFGLASSPGNLWSDLEVTLIFRLVQQTSAGLRAGRSEEPGHSLQSGLSVQMRKPSPWR